MCIRDRTYSYETKSIDLIPIARVPEIIDYIQVTLNGTSSTVIQSGDTYPILSLPEGNTTVTFTVRTLVGADKQYTVNIYRNPYESPIPTLASAIEVYDQTYYQYNLTPNYDPDEHSYYVSVPSTFESGKIRVYAQSNDSDPSNVNIKINGNIASNGAYTDLNNIIDGDNIITIELSNAQGNKEYYTVIINRALSGIDAKLDNLVVKQSFALVLCKRSVNIRIG